MEFDFKKEFIKNTNELKELIEVTLKNRLDEIGFIDIENDNGISITIYADDFELSTPDIDDDIERGYHIGMSENSAIKIIFKRRFNDVAELYITNRNELCIDDDMLYSIRG